jgi:hypothetical protein
MRSELTQVRQALSGLESRVASNQVALDEDLTDDSLVTALAVKTPTLDFLQWAANRGTEFQYGENPYDDFRIVWLSELIQQLTKAGFQGVINLQAHYGDFCLTHNEAGTLTLAKEQMPFSECLFSSKVEDKGFTQVSYQTIGFANFINSLSAEEGGPVEVFVEADARDGSVVPYPETYAVKTAGEWNRVATQNQRIQVSLFQKTGL